jgi:hypothetical protein
VTEIKSLADAEKAIENQKGNINDEMDMTEINAYHQGLQDALDILRELEAGVRERMNFLSPPLAKDSLTIKELRRVLEGDKPLLTQSFDGKMEASK